MTKITIMNNDHLDSNTGVIEILVDGETHVIHPGAFIEIETLPEEKISIGNPKAKKRPEPSTEGLPDGWLNKKGELQDGST